MNGNQQTIKMVAINPLTNKLEEVYPESEVTIEEMTPRFLAWTGSHDRVRPSWVYIDGVTAADVYEDWLNQM